MKKYFLLFTICTFSLGLLATTANAGERTRSGTVSGQNGRGGAYNNTISRDGQGNVTRNQSVTTNNGKTLNRNVARDYDKETGTATRTITGNNGQTRTTTGSVENGVASGTYTTGNGKTGTFEATGTRNEDGTTTRSSTVTTQEGKVVNRSTTTGYDRETGTLNRTITNNKGKTRTGTLLLQPNAGNQ